jgi:serine/threonine protein kinase
MLFLSILVYLAMLVDNVWSSCDSASLHKEFLEEYFRKDSQVNLVGKGGFGLVTEFKYKGDIFAVKEVGMTIEQKVYNKVQQKFYDERRDLVDHCKRFMKENFNFFNYSRWSELPSDKLVNVTKEESDSLQELFQYYKARIKLFVSEIESNRLIKKKAIENPTRIQTSFKYCIQMTGLDYLIVQEKYGPSFINKKFLEVFKTWSIQEQIKLYFKVIRSVEYINDIGIAHCDLKEENILWKDESYKEFAIIDFGLSSRKSKCNGGTNQYEAPEVASSVVHLTSLKEIFKADTFSLGIMITFMHGRVNTLDPEFLTYDQVIESRVKGQQPSHQIEVFESPKLQQGSQNPTEESVIFINSPRDILNREFKLAILKMTEWDYGKRSSVSDACKSFWMIFQISNILNQTAEEALEFFWKVNVYLDQILGGKIVCEDLPLDDSWTQEVEKYCISLHSKNCFRKSIMYI